MSNSMNIFQKMSAITLEIGTVAKNLTVATGRSSSYKAVSERDVIDAVKPIEAKYGVYSYPVDREILESHILESESEYQGKVAKKTTFMTRMKVIYRFVNMDNPTEFIDTVTFAEGIDSQDKGSGKAMTYADKYALMKSYKMSTGDDPDQDASKDTHYQKASPRDELVKLLAQKGIDASVYAKEHNLTKASKDEEFKKHVAKLKDSVDITLGFIPTPAEV